MRYLIILLTSFMFVLTSIAQEDDMYFAIKKSKNSSSKQITQKVDIIYETESATSVQQHQNVEKVPSLQERDIDEYNRRGRSNVMLSVDSLCIDSVPVNKTNQKTDEIFAQKLYDLGYSDGYGQGFSDGEDMDYYYALRLARFHGCHYYDPWYWSHVTYVYDPWHWDLWFYDSWFRPYYYSGWHHTGWGIGYWGHRWNPYWLGYYSHHHHFPHRGHRVTHIHKHYGHHNNISRNRDYGRMRIKERSVRGGERGYTVGSSNHGISNNRNNNYNTDRTTRFNDRVNSRNNRVTDRSRTNTKRTNRIVNRATERKERSVNHSNPNSPNRFTERTSNRNTERSSSRISRNSSNSSRGGSFS